MVKLSGLIWVNTAGPTVTATGMVMLSPDVWNRNWPMKVPGDAPPPGRAALLTPMVMVDGAVPLEAEAVNQLPPTAVLAVALQFKVPDPCFRICIDFEIWVPLGLMETINFS